MSTVQNGRYTREEALKARLEKETLPGQWMCIAILPYADAIAIQEIMQRNDFESTISCRCGSYAYGECGLCAEEQNA